MSRRIPRWIPVEELNVVLRELGADDTWAGEMSADREMVDVTDPWDLTA